MNIFGKKLFTWQSATQQKKEQEEYAKWAFPYGDLQRDNLKSLLNNLLKKDDGFINKHDSFMLYIYLTCKEMYEKALLDYGCRDLAIKELVDNRMGVSLQVIKQVKQNDWLKYISLVLADENIDENCIYPTSDTIIENAQKLKMISEK